MESWLSTGLFTLVVVRLCTPLSLNTTNALVSMFTVLNDGNGNTLQLKSVQSAVCILPSVCIIPLHSPQSAVHSLQSTVRSPQSVVYSPQSAVHSPQSAVHSPQSTVLCLQSTVCSPQSTVCSQQTVNLLHCLVLNLTQFNHTYLIVWLLFRDTANGLFDYMEKKKNKKPKNFNWSIRIEKLTSTETFMENLTKSTLTSWVKIKIFTWNIW